MRVQTALLLMLSLSACRVTVPTAEEQADLVRRKTFPSGAPAWFAQGTPGATSAPGSVIPEILSPPPAVAPRTEDVNYPVLVRAEELKQGAAPESAQRELSVLDRINKLCPGNEKEINAALTNTDLASRLAQHKTLAQKCPMSADIQNWLGNDYAKSGKLIDARTAYQQALVLDPTNEDAKAGIIRVDEALRK